MSMLRFSCCLFPLLLSAQPCPHCAGNRPFPGAAVKMTGEAGIGVSVTMPSVILDAPILPWVNVLLSTYNLSSGHA